MSFETNGFLGKEAIIASQQIVKKHQDLFGLCTEINSSAHKVKSEFVVHNRDFQEIVAAILFTRILEGFQAVILLTSHGFREETSVQSRAVLEALILLAVCCQHREFFFLYFAFKEFSNQLRTVQVVHDSPSDALPSLREYASHEFISKLRSSLESMRKRMDDEGVKSGDFHVDKLAKRVGLSLYYNSVCRYSSEAIHSSPTCIRTYMETNQEGDIVELKHGWDDRNTVMNLLSAAHFLLTGMEMACPLFRVDIEEEVKQFLSRLAEIKE